MLFSYGHLCNGFYVDSFPASQLTQAILCEVIDIKINSIFNHWHGFL